MNATKVFSLMQRVRLRVAPALVTKAIDGGFLWFQLKVIVIADKLEVVCEESLKFDDIAKYKTSGGCHIHSDGLTVTAPTIMWVEALDILLDRLLESGFDFSRVRALSGAGQQHGSIYWKHGSAAQLKKLDSSSPLHKQLAESFSVSDSPIWMDSSTTKQCQTLEDIVGGAQTMADITGSKAYERFTGNQILKLIQTDPEAYKSTERISLVSSFAATLFLGEYSSIDESDGSGMNLMDIHTRKWDSKLIEACSNDLSSKLGDPVPSINIQGVISSYFVERYGFSSSCQVISFTGDNPASLAGMRLGANDIAVSLGSSDVVFLWLSDPKPKTEGHVFVNPVDTHDYMALLCFKNGSLTRESIRDKYSFADWSKFEELLSDQPIGNGGKIGLYYTICEIIPSNVEGCYYFDENDVRVDDFSPSIHVRALIEGQFLSRRIHAEDMGFQLGSACKILATGGASHNKNILQVLSDVFNAPVYTQDVANSAALGGAFLAMHASKFGDDGISFQELLKDGPEFKLAVTPQPNSKEVYDAMAVRYRHLEKSICETK